MKKNRQFRLTDLPLSYWHLSEALQAIQHVGANDRSHQIEGSQGTTSRHFHNVPLELITKSVRIPTVPVHIGTQGSGRGKEGTISDRREMACRDEIKTHGTTLTTKSPSRWSTPHAYHRATRYCPHDRGCPIPYPILPSGAS